MITQKILIFGVTGNYSKIKVLPALKQYFELYSDQVNIEIYGYSRSEPDSRQIQEILGLEAFKKTTFVQGEYSDTSFLSSLVDQLKTSDRLIVYLAVPPSTYLAFLNGLTSYNQLPIDILIEKPFGQSLNEAGQILEIASKCGLYEDIHFVDHYLFKSAARINLTQVGKKLKLSFDDLLEIKIQALETIGVEDRAGYYDQTGALKDMFPHLYSLFDYSLSLFGNVETPTWEVTKNTTSQYEGYKTEVGNPNSTTETYFNSTLKANFKQLSVKVILESGKKTEQKLTQVTLSFKNDLILQYQIAPQAFIKLIKQGEIIKEIPIFTSHILDHTKVFEDVSQFNFASFVDNDKILDYWHLFDKLTS